MKRSFSVVRLAILALMMLVSLAAPSIVVVAEADTPASEYPLGGLIPSPPGDYPTLEYSSALSSLPGAIDLSAGLPPVGNQSRTSSCVGWAVAYYYRSYQEGAERGAVPTEDNEIFSPSFVYNQRQTSDCSRDSGMSMVNGLRIVTEQGAATLATMPFTSDTCQQPSDEAVAEAAQYRAESYYQLFLGKGGANLATLKAHLATGDPFLLAVPIYSEFYRVTSVKPVIDVPGSGSTFYGGHAVLVVGYDDEQQRFKFVNSWNRYWGEEGFAYFTYDFVRSEGWEAWAIVDEDTTPPSAPAEAYELSGAVSGELQSEIDAPTFAWAASSDPQAVYDVYWGEDEAGTAAETVREALYAPEALTGPATMFLRLRAVDASGNASEWRTLFEFVYEPIDEAKQMEPLTPVFAEESPLPSRARVGIPSGATG